MSRRKPKPHFSVSEDSRTFDAVLLKIMDYLSKFTSINSYSVFAECSECIDCRKESTVSSCRKLLFLRREVTKEASNTEVIEEASDFHFYTQDSERVRFTIVVTHSGNPIRPRLEECKRQATSQFSKIARGKFTSLRDSVVESSLVSTDTSSFAYRSLQALRGLIDFDGASIFVFDPRTDKLELAATTGIKKLNDHNLRKHDVFYFADSNSYTSHCFSDGMAIVEQDEGPLTQNTFGEDVEMIVNRVYLPLQVRKSTLKNGEKIKNFERLGVIRIVNLRKDGAYANYSRFDDHLISYFCEFLCVLIRLYQKASNPFGVLERATHGFVHDLAVLGGRVEELSLTVFDPYVRSVLQQIGGEGEKRANFAPLLDQLTQLNSTFQLFKEDMLGIRESMAAQLHSILDTTDFSAGKKSEGRLRVTEQPYREVLYRVTRSLPFIARSHRRLPPKFHISRDGDPNHQELRYIPTLRIDPDVLYLVFRNLIENSIKYKREDRGSSEIMMDWTAGRKFVRFIFQDDGIGIAPEEEKYLFREGFRGRNTMQLSTRGNGIGLAYSRSALKPFEAKLSYEGIGLSGRGAKFKIEVRRD